MEQGWRSQKPKVLCGLGEGDAGQGVGQGTGKMLMGKAASPLLHSLQPCSTANALGTENLGSIKGPSVSKEGTEMGDRSGEPGISPKHSQMRRMAEREGSDMPDLG